MKDYVKTPAQVKIPAKGSTVLSLDVTMPCQANHSMA
ncbi:cell surface protein [Lacticaseibacillus paracasei subsp. paracasei Lpp125]|nr:cell surface protein [Lacticaseibacillus paracasei subsp. paracasei Lpp125]